MESRVADNGPVCYEAAGAVVVSDNHVLVLRRPSRCELRLPKGHVESSEGAQAAALRETCEESGYANLVVVADLDTQTVEFNHKGRHIVRAEQYFLMELKGSRSQRSRGEKQFKPTWMTWEEALAALTFEAEREWVRRAWRVWQALPR